MFESIFFGTWFGLTMVGAILIDQDGKQPWGAAWFILLNVCFISIAGWL